MDILSFDGIPLFRVAVKWLVTAVTVLLKEFWVTVEDLRRAAFHQANGGLLAAVLDASALLPTRCIRCWNGSAMPYSASLPIALDHAVRAQIPGRRAG